MVKGGQRNPRGNDGKSMLLQTQSMALMTAHSQVEGGRCQGVAVPDNIMVTTDRDGADGSQDADGALMVQIDTAGTGDLGEAAVASV